MGQGSRWASVINPMKKSKMCCCCLPPDRVKLTEQQERNKGYGQIGPKGVKLGQAHFDSESNRAKESRWVDRNRDNGSLILRTAT